MITTKILYIFSFVRIIMCQAIKFSINNQQLLFSISDENPTLPILLPDNRIMIIPWGKQDHSYPVYPIGHTAHMDDVRQQVWKAYWPKSVRIGCDAFLMRNKHGQEQWHHLNPGQFIKGLATTAFGGDRVYILMRNPEILDPADHTEWPVLNCP